MFISKSSHHSAGTIWVSKQQAKYISFRVQKTFVWTYTQISQIYLLSSSPKQVQNEYQMIPKFDTQQVFAFVFSGKNKIFHYLFLKMGQPRPLFHLFSSFQTHIAIFTTNKCEKYSSSIQGWDLTSRPLEHESPPISTRPGLLPIFNYLCLKSRY